jgi:hypothetical protein
MKLDAPMNSLPEATEGGIPDNIAVPVVVVCIIGIAVIVWSAPRWSRQPVVFLLLACVGLWFTVVSRDAFSLVFFCLAAGATAASWIDSHSK